MLKRSFYKTRNDGVNLYRNYSDEGFLIKQIETGQLYQEAIDVEDASYTYEEMKEKIEDSSSYTYEETKEKIEDSSSES